MGVCRYIADNKHEPEAVDEGPADVIMDVVQEINESETHASKEIEIDSIATPIVTEKKKVKKSW